MGMRLKGRSMNDPEITRKPRGNHAVITRFSRLITSTLLLLFTFAIGNVWAACDPGTIFKFEVKDGLTNGNIAAGNPIDLSSYVTVTAGSVSAYGKKDGSLAVDNAKYLKIVKKAESYFICTLSDGCSLQAGDIIRYSISSYNALLQPATDSGDDDKLALAKPSSAYTLQTATIPVGHALIGESTFYIFAASNNGLYKSIEIIRPTTITLDAATNGGIAVANATGVVGDKVVLPHAFKKDTEPLKYYKFKGWYDNASAGTKQADYYTISSATTLYAQFEDNPSSGTMFSLEMQSSMKPASEVTVKNTTGYVQELDLLQYALISGGAAKLKNSSSNNHAKITTSGQISLAGSNGNVQIDLDFPLQAGDVIAPNVSAKTWITTGSASAKPSDGPYVDNSENKTYTVTAGDGIVGTTSFKLWNGSNATTTIITITRPVPASTYTLTLNPAGGAITPVPTGWTYDDVNGKYIKANVEDGSSVDLLALTKSGYLLDGWKDGESTDYTSPVTIDGADLTLTAQWASAHTVSFEANGGGSSMSPVVVKDGTTYTIPACDFTPVDANHAFSSWAITGVAGKTTGMPDETFTMPAGDVTLTTQWAASYGITKGSHTNGDFTIDPTSAAAGATITLAATPNAGYLFDAWEVVKTSDGTSAGVTVTNDKFTMPAFAVTVNATFVADTRKKILYLTSATTEGDKLYEALKDDYNVTVAAPDAQTLTDYDLVVLHESISGNAANPTHSDKKQVILDIPTTTIPVLNTKSYFYTSARWNWGGAANGKQPKGVHVNNTAYCNITSHPLFAGLTPDANDSIIILSSINGDNKPMQPVTSFVSGKEGYSLANVPDGCAIHELTPAQRGVASGKYLLISIYNKDLANLNANGQKLFQNAAAYLLDGSASWTPIPALSDPAIAATPSATYAAGDDIALAASATGTIAGTTYTWYKGATLEAAIEAGAIKATATAAAGGNAYEKASCVAGDAGTYWCVMSNGTDCEASASLEVTVTAASNITFESAHGTAPSATTGASYTLPELTESGWVHQGWTASIDVTVDEAVVTAGTRIANGKVASFGADVKFTAVWAEVFAVTFNMQEHGAAIDPQNIVSGGKVTKPADPSESGWDFGGWYKESTCENEWDFATDVVSTTTTIFAKWTEDPCPTPFSLSKVVLTSASDGTVTGYNGNEYAGEKVIGGLSSTETAEVDASHDGTETGYKLNNGGSAIVFATLKKGTFQEGDRVVVTITKKQDAYKVEEVPQPILDIYYGTDKNDATFLTTIENVTAAGSYTYRLTAADVTAIGTKKGIGVFRPGSGRTQNPYVYSVEIKGCRSFAVSHQVTYDMMSHGAQVDPQTVPEGDLLTKPSVVEPEGWAFVGWYKENTLENEWDFTTDVMGTSDMTLYAKWESEVGVIKLFSNTGDLNTTNFVSPAKADDPIVIDEVSYPTLVAFGNNRADLKGTTPADVVQYNAATNAAKIKLDLYNNNSGDKKAYLWMVEEGDETATPIEISVPGKKRLTTSYYTFNSEKNRSFYLTTDAKADMRVLQVKVMDNGTAIHQFGQAGYAVNLEKGRISAASAVAITFEGAIISADAYSVLNSSNLKPKNYIQFNNAVANTVIRITKSSSNAYYVTNDLENKGASYTTDQEIVLPTTGTWYVGSVSTGSLAAFSKIEFIAPKCEEPQFNALANSDICSGDPYVALDGTGTVTDGGTITYKWYAEGGTDVLGTEATYMPTADGSYFVVALHHVDGYTDNEATSDVVTVATHTGTAITEPLVDLRGAKDAVVTLTVTATGKALHYAWKESATIDGTYTDVAGAADAATLDVTITEGMDKYYKVVVSGDCGSDLESIAHVTQFVPVVQQDVTGSIVWDWTKAASVNEIKLTASTTPKKNEGFVMANGAATIYNNANFESDKLYLEGEYIIREGKYFQGQMIKFNTTVAGLVRVKFSHTGNNKPARELYINGVGTGDTRTSATAEWSKYVEVPAGEVSITAYFVDPTEGAGIQYIRVPQIEFYAYDTERNDSWIAPGELGTICYPNGHVFTGAEVYEMAGVDSNGKFVFDEVTVTEPGKPYLFVATSNDPIKFYKTMAAAEANPIANNGMIGTFVSIDLDYTDARAAKWYYFSGTKFYAVSKRASDLNVPANRAYVDLNESHPAGAPKQGVRRITFNVDGMNAATGMDELNASETPVKMLIDGQLFILRGEKMYNANGQLVK